MLPNQRVITRGNQRGHVEGLTYMPSSAGDGAHSSHFSTISVEGSDADQKRDLLPHALPKFRQPAQQGVRADPRNALQNAILLAPSRAFLDPLFDVLVQGLDLLTEEFQNGYGTTFVSSSGFQNDPLDGSPLAYGDQFSPAHRRPR